MAEAAKSNPDDRGPIDSPGRRDFLIKATVATVSALGGRALLNYILGGGPKEAEAAGYDRKTVVDKTPLEGQLADARQGLAVDDRKLQDVRKNRVERRKKAQAVLEKTGWSAERIKMQLDKDFPLD